MKTILLSLAIVALFSAVTSVCLAERPRTDLIRDSRGQIVEKWTWQKQPNGGWRITVRDAAGKLLRVFVLPPAK